MKTINILKVAVGLLSSMGASQLAHANLEIRFNESAPKDIFTIENMSECDLTNVLLDIDLSKSTGGLIFDTTATGAGVEVFQPFEVRQGNMTLISANSVRDGDSALSVRIDQIAAGATVSFTIDVDDTLSEGELGNIRVSGSEIQGGLVRVTNVADDRLVATFGKTSKALIELQASCA
jgi:hypothetical protein